MDRGPDADGELAIRDDPADRLAERRPVGVRRLRREGVLGTQDRRPAVRDALGGVVDGRAGVDRPPAEQLATEGDDVEPPVAPEALRDVQRRVREHGHEARRPVQAGQGERALPDGEVQGGRAARGGGTPRGAGAGAGAA